VIYRFGIFAFDDRAALLTRSGRPVPLEPQPARALALLLARAGDLVSREELRAHLWGEDTHVDFDRGLAYCIRELRAALGDSADNPRFVQTRPRLGFSFIAPVEPIADGETPAAAPVETPAPPVPGMATVVGGWTVAAAIAVVALIVGAAGALMVARDRPSPRPIVAVAAFENESGDPSYDRAIAGVSDVIVERLTALGPARVGVNGNAGVLRRPRADRDLKAVARETGAAFLVSGQLQTKDGMLSLLMQLIRIDDGTHVWVQRIGRPAGDRLDALDDEAARQIEAAVAAHILKS
jgi:DNA-binding winged helix-turn-helix (wHTH) protein/TolB-like protein